MVLPWAQLFEGRLALNPCFLFLFSKQFSRIIFSVILELSITNLWKKRIKTEMLSNLNSNLLLTLSYLNPALNNSALKYKPQVEDTVVYT